MPRCFLLIFPFFYSFCLVINSPGREGPSFLRSARLSRRNVTPAFLFCSCSHHFFIPCSPGDSILPSSSNATFVSALLFSSPWAHDCGRAGIAAVNPLFFLLAVHHLFFHVWVPALMAILTFFVLVPPPSPLLWCPFNAFLCRHRLCAVRLFDSLATGRFSPHPSRPPPFLPGTTRGGFSWALKLETPAVSGLLRFLLHWTFDHWGLMSPSLSCEASLVATITLSLVGRDQVSLIFDGPFLWSFFFSLPLKARFSCLGVEQSL